MRFWLMVAMRVRDRRIRHNDTKAIRAVCAEVEGLVRKRETPK